MAIITFITSGIRSGKSSFAQKLAVSASSNPVYLATARIWDEDFRLRIERHQADRGLYWTNIAEEKQLSSCAVEGKTVLLDCITLWLTNIFFDNQFDADRSLEEAKDEWNRFVQKNMNLIVVSNELEMGIHPVEESARKFADCLGANQLGYCFWHKKRKKMVCRLCEHTMFKRRIILRPDHKMQIISERIATIIVSECCSFYICRGHSWHNKSGTGYFA